MQFDPNKFTIKAQEALQAAATLAGSLQHQQVEPEHLLFAMLEDRSSIAVQIAQKIEAPLDNLQAALQRQLERLPKVTGASATGQYLSQNLGKVFDLALKEAETLKDEYISSEHLLLALSEAGTTLSGMLRDAGIDHNSILKVLSTIRGSQRVTSQSAEETYNSLKKYSRNLNDQARQGKLDPVIGRDEEIRRV
ncbi:MAG: chaperone protein ClpB, partial [Chlorobiaceae bacterium]|nr:chaperone protein ClpB [Chlorobiaceae bacterium]